MGSEIKDNWLDVGCGLRKAGGWIGLDIRKFDGVDFVLNVGKDDFPFPDNYFSKIQSIHTLEHLYPEELFHCVDECWRVCKPDGFFHVEVPAFGTQAWNIHPDHKLMWNKDMLSFFQPPDSGVDPHGYLRGFWHVEFLEHPNPETLEWNWYPNKPGITRYPYKEVKGVGEVL